MLTDLGYHIVYFNLDTEGYLHADNGEEIQKSKDIWDKAIDGKNPCNTTYLAIEHDLQEQVVYNLTEYMLKSLLENGYRPVTVGECLGDPPQNWYRAGKGEVPEYSYTPITPTGTISCAPGTQKETGVSNSNLGNVSETATTTTASVTEESKSASFSTKGSSGTQVDEPIATESDGNPSSDTSPASSRFAPPTLLYLMTMLVLFYEV